MCTIVTKHGRSNFCLPFLLSIGIEAVKLCYELVLDCQNNMRQVLIDADYKRWLQKSG